RYNVWRDFTLLQLLKTGFYYHAIPAKVNSRQVGYTPHIPVTAVLPCFFFVFGVMPVRLSVAKQYTTGYLTKRYIAVKIITFRGKGKVLHLMRMSN
ncbi:MAG: hypothetical protein MJ142_07760, partial [Clostridia bacterium]|nr:hypothetical protein [Clostridia bacterium]